MIPVYCDQGSPEWVAARVGRLTASVADQLVTPAKLQKSAGADKLLARLLAEWVMGMPDEEWQGNYWTERGHAFEAEARAFFEFATGHVARPVGFLYRDEQRMCGCSPDGLVNLSDNPGAQEHVGGLELKVPKLSTHLLYRLRGGLPREYAMQIQFSLWVTRLPKWWFMSYSPVPNVDPVLVEVEPDAKTQDALSKHVPPFLDELLTAKDLLLAEGVEPMDPADTMGEGEWSPEPAAGPDWPA